MFPKFVLTILLVSCGDVFSSELDLQPIMQLHQKAMQMLMHTYNIAAFANPSAQVQPLAGEVSADECFQYYNSEQAVISSTYNKAYNGCVNTAKSAKATLTKQSAQQRAALVARGQGICTSLSDCENTEDGLKFFQCYHQAASSNVNGLYEVSADSETAYNTLSVEYQKIDDEETVCTTSAKNAYVTSLSTSASNLNKCLVGEWVPPTATTTEPEATTTEEPATTTEEPATTSTTEESTVVVTTEEAPTTEAETTIDDSEDSARIVKHKSKKHIWNIMKRF